MSGRYEDSFIILIPLAAASIWRFASYLNQDFSPFLIITVSLVFFSFGLGQALISTGVLILLVTIDTMSGFGSGASVIWLPLSGVVCAGMFWMMRREREWFRSRFVSIQSRARGLMSTSQNVALSDSIPEIDEETQMAKAVASVFKIDRIAGWILEIIFNVMHPHSCFFFFLDTEDGFLKVMSFRTKSKYFNKDATYELDSKGLFAWVVQNKRQLRHERLPRSMQFPLYYTARERILSCMLFPVIKNGVVEGIIGVDSRRSYSFGVDEERMLEQFASLMGDIIEAFRNYQQKVSHADSMEAFYSASKRILETKLNLGKRLDLLLQIGSMIKKCEEMVIAVPGDDGKFILRKSEGTFLPKLLGAAIHPKSVVGSLIQKSNDTVIWESDTNGSSFEGIFTPVEHNLKINSLLVVPLPMEDRLMGVLCLASRRRDYFTQNDKFYFNSLAAQFGFALENAINAQRIEQLAVTDGLTGIYNHRYFQDTLIREIKRADREPRQFSLLMIDIDYFKRFNDTYGHQAGDEVLKGVARLLQEEARDADLVARYGGEEFVLLLISCDLKMAGKTAERIRKLCGKKKFTFNGESVSVTLSIGVASFPDQGREPAILISAADAGLYEAKRAGRNRVVMPGSSNQG